MNICNEHSAEICHDSRDCPACEIQNDLNTANEEIETLKAEIERLKSELEEANTKE